MSDPSSRPARLHRAEGEHGNPLGVFLDGAEVPDGRRQAVARDLGFSETVFVDERGERRAAASSRRRSSCRSPGTRRSARPGCWPSAGRGPSAAAAGRRGPVRLDGELVWIAGRPEWAPPFCLPPARLAGRRSTRSRPLDGGDPLLGLGRRGRGQGPLALLRARGRGRRGRGDRLGDAGAVRPARPADRGPPRARLAALRPAARRRQRPRSAAGSCSTSAAPTTLPG